MAGGLNGASGQLDVDEHGEQSALNRVLEAARGQGSFQNVPGQLRLPASEVQRRERPHCVLVLLEPGEQVARLLQPALVQAQVRQPAQHVAADLAVLAGKHVQRAGKLSFGLGPPARRGQDAPVVRAAVPANRGEPPPPHVVVRRAQPLLSASDVVRALAGMEQPTEDTFHDRQVLNITGADNRQRLVETGHSLADVAGEAEHDPQGRERVALEVRIATPARGLVALR